MNDQIDPSTPAREPEDGVDLLILGPTTRAPRRRRRIGVLAAATAAAVVSGGVAWGVHWYTADGAQAAEAVPADAVAYLGITLDPSGAQKLDALSTLKRFPDVKRFLGLDGDLRDVDVKKALLEAAFRAAPCEGTTAADVDGWLGDRAGIAYLPNDPEDVTAGGYPVGVLEVDSDADARRGLAALATCDGGSGQDTGYAVRDGWAAISDTTAHAEQALAAGADASLAEDAGFQRWTARAGDAGVVTGYAAPTAPGFALSAVARAISDELSDVPGSDRLAGRLEQRLADRGDETGFEGAGLQLRFAGDSLELDAVAATTEVEQSGRSATGSSTYAGGELAADLPTRTALALGFGMPAESGFADAMARNVGALPAGVPPALRRLPALLGALLDGGFALGAGPEVGQRAGFDQPVALVVPGREAPARRLVALATRLGLPGLAVENNHGRTVLGLDQAWTHELAAGSGGLGLSDGYRDATGVDGDSVPALVGYADLGTLIASAGGDAAASVGALRVGGFSLTTDGGLARLTARVTTG